MIGKPSSSGQTEYKRIWYGYNRATWEKAEQLGKYQAMVRRYNESHGLVSHSKSDSVRE